MRQIEHERHTDRQRDGGHERHRDTQRDRYTRVCDTDIQNERERERDRERGRDNNRSYGGQNEVRRVMDGPRGRR